MITIASALAGADMILKAGRAHLLPDPFAVSFDTDRVSLQFWTLDELTAWATYVDAPIGAHTTKRGTHHSVEAELFEQPLRLSCYVRAGVVAS